MNMGERYCLGCKNSECSADHQVWTYVPATINQTTKRYTNRVQGDVCIVADSRSVGRWSIEVIIISVKEQYCPDGGWLRECDLPIFWRSVSSSMNYVFMIPSKRGPVHLKNFTVTAGTCCC